MAARDHIVLYINGARHVVRGGDCFATLSDYLRQRLRLVGTKIVCSEGDCGACTVLVGHPAGEQLEYRPIDSCIRFMFQLDATHVVTIEGITPENGLTAVQQAMIDCHGSQCGFCTPGFVMSMTGRLEEPCVETDEESWRSALTGNLCRCTGYTTILQAGCQSAAEQPPRLNEIYEPGAILNELKRLRNDTLDLLDSAGKPPRRAYCPASLGEAVAFRAANPSAKIVAGATDVGVQCNKRTIAPDLFLDLNRIAALEGARVKAVGARRTLIAGARTSWTELLELCRDEVPEFTAILSVFGAPQIRHVGTIGGNIINASPIADSLPFLLVAEAELELRSPRGLRHVNINEFYRGYKQFDLLPDELLTGVRVPLPPTGELLRLYKVSRRRDLDIATFTAAIRMRLEGNRIAAAAIAYGAVAPIVLRLHRTEEFLRGEPFSEETMRRAGEVAVTEIAPISDVRGSAEYRRLLARNVLLKFFHEYQFEEAAI